jgi:hypothetical protein
LRVVRDVKPLLGIAPQIRFEAEAKCQRALRGGEGIFERRLRSVNIRAMGEDVGHAI